MGIEQSSTDRALAEAQATIAEQAAEIERLRRQLADTRFAEELRQALILGATASTVAAPVTHARLLEMIVETAAHVISAKAGSLFLIDEEAQELIFEVALGEKAEDVKKFRVPLGHGIAGLVAVTGQPMAISDAGADSRQASDIAEQIDYKPQNILCVPLFYGDDVIGVLELLDKEGADSFGPEDMEALSLFANQAAVAIEQSRTQGSVASLLFEILSTTEGISPVQQEWLRERAASFAAGVEEDSAYRHAIDLGRLVQQIVTRGEDEAELCRNVLTSFKRYAELHSGPAIKMAGMR
jgi:GAF domain-containing protein